VWRKAWRKELVIDNVCEKGRERESGRGAGRTEWAFEVS